VPGERGRRPATTPIPEKKSEAESIPAPESQAPNLGTPKLPSLSNPKPSPRAKAREEQTLVQKPPPVAPNLEPQVKAPVPKPQRQAKASAPRQQQQAKPPAPKPQQQAKASAPRQQQQAKPPAPKPQPQKPAAQKESPTKQGGKGTKANPNPKKN
jgi:hypothetical protein